VADGFSVAWIRSPQKSRGLGADGEQRRQSEIVVQLKDVLVSNYQLGGSLATGEPAETVVPLINNHHHQSAQQQQSRVGHQS
jgi:hypothetical protein